MIFTIGHGNRSIEEFIGMLREAEIAHLIDVRAFPGSRRYPQFGREALERSVAQAGMQYLWEGEALGGRRKSRADSRHVALRNESFRAYADHMEFGEFLAAEQRLTALSANENVAIMCAERLPWECHRFLISDYLVARGLRVVHLINEGKRQEHKLNSVARVQGEQIIYDWQTQDALEL